MTTDRLQPPMQSQLAQRVGLLLAHLDARPDADGVWDGWRITRIHGGLNNLLYRATGHSLDLAVKFTIRDGRDRAGREYNALLALQQAGLPVAPEPILLERLHYSQPAVVQTWLDGRVSSAPPTTDAEWTSLLQHFATVHSLTPDKTDVRLLEAVNNARDVEQGRRVVRGQADLIPAGRRPPSLQALLRRFEAVDFPPWSEPSVALCRADNNIQNVIRRTDGWASVDWEASGWGDPAFDMAELITHPAYIDVPLPRWEWVIATYCEWMGDDRIASRIRVYHRMKLVWWAARTARYLQQGSTEWEGRLVTQPEGWQGAMREKYEHYLVRASALL